MDALRLLHDDPIVFDGRCALGSRVDQLINWVPMSSAYVLLLYRHYGRFDCRHGVRDFLNAPDSDLVHERLYRLSFRSGLLQLWLNVCRFPLV